MAARLSALGAGRFLPPGRFLVLISDRGWVDPRAIVRLEGLGKLKNPPHPVLDPATFQFEAQYLNQLCYSVHLGSSNLLDLIFSNLSDLHIISVDPGCVKPDNYHHPLIINIYLPFATCIQITYIRTVNSSLRIMICFIIFNLRLVLCVSCHLCRFSCRQPQCCCSRCHGTGNPPRHHKL
jgi:hypothetical protein